MGAWIRSKPRRCAFTCSSQLLVVTNQVFVGALFDHPIYRVTKMTTIDVTDSDAYALEAIRSVARLDGYYYSPTLDLTERKLLHSTHDSMKNREGRDFFWNNYAMKSLLGSRYLRPCIAFEGQMSLSSLLATFLHTFCLSALTKLLSVREF